MDGKATPEGIGKGRSSMPKVSKMSQKGAENDPNGAERVPKLTN